MKIDAHCQQQNVDDGCFTLITETLL